MLQKLGSFKTQLWLERAVFAFLFCGTAAIIVWQNSRVAVLWDLSYILENSFRISLGDVPYRDFPFPYAPLTFLVQALLIKTTGAVFWHHIAYCAIIGGFSTALTWRILLNLLRDARVPHAQTIALLLALPLIILGNYCVFPHPFYDCDCTFYILLCIFLWQRAESKNFPALPTFLTGVIFVIPLFVKQNTGLAFLASVAVALFVLLGIEARFHHHRPPRGYLVFIGGIAAGLGTALAIIHLTAGLENYYHWTVTFAAERRTPALGEMLSVYADWTLLMWLILFALGTILLRRSQSGKWPLFCLAILALAAPLIWSVFYLFLDTDASERAERLVAAYPFVLIVSFVLALLTTKRRNGIALVLPFVLIATIHGVFMSQQLWGSTYAIWPLLIILIAGMIVALFELLENLSFRIMPELSATIAVSLLISGGFYLASNERLDYASIADGELNHSRFAQLQGLSVRGSWMTDFEELVDDTNREIPREDGILMLPGEDLFYYTTGRHPRFPVVMFDHTINPYNSEEIISEVRSRNINWLIMKNDLQLDENPLEDKKHLEDLLHQDFKHVESLNNYEIFRRRTAADTNDDEDDDKSDDTDDDDSSDSDDS